MTQVSSPILFGRAAERGQLAAALAEVASGGRASLVVEGEAGVGKTRLVNDVAADAAADGFTVLRGACFDLGPTGLGPLVSALRPLVAELGPSLDRVRGELGAMFPELGSGLGQPSAARVPELVGLLLREAAAKTPVLLILEDLHWADTSTLGMVDFLVRSLPPRIALVVTYRTDDLSRRHPLRGLLAELDRARLVTRLPLGPLGRADVERLVAALLGVVPDPTVVANVVSRADGLPLYVEELVADSESALSDRLGNLLLARVSRAPREVREVLGVVAVGGPLSVPGTLVAEVLGTEPDALIDPLREAVAWQLLVAHPDESYSFRHALVWEAVYEDLLPQERTRWHRAYARALDRRIGAPGRTPSVLELSGLARHFYASHELGPALRLAVQAADRQLAFAPAEALAHYERALDVWDRVDDPAEHAGLDHVELLERAAEASCEASNHPRWAQYARAALRALEEQPDPEPARMARLHQGLAGALLHLADHEGSDAALASAVEVAARGGDDVALVAALGHQAAFQRYRMRLTESDRLGEEALRIADAAGVDATALRLGHARTQAWLGRVEEAERVAVELYANAVPDELVEPALVLGTVHYLAGRPAEAIEVLDDAWARLEREGAGSSAKLSLLVDRVGLLLVLGRWDELRTSLEAAAAIAPRGNSQVAELHAISGALAARTGEAETAWADLLAAVGHWRRADLVPCGGDHFVELARARLLAGDPDAAASIAAGVLDELAGCEAALFSVRLVRVGLQTGRLSGLTHTEAMERLSAYERLGMFPAGGLGEAELRTVRALAGVASWVDAVAAWDRMGAPYEAAEARLGLGRAQLAAGDRDSAGETLRAARETASRLGAAPLLADLDALLRAARLAGGQSERPAADAFALTGRERDVLELLALGRTNREIGESLFISEKTASVHVSNLIAKLGVANRTEAAAKARAVGLLA